MPRPSRRPQKPSIACREARSRTTWRPTLNRNHRATPAQDVEARCRRALAFVSGVESPTSLSSAMLLPHLEPEPGNITFTITIIILFRAAERHPARLLPSLSPPLLAGALPVRRAALPEAAPKPAPARLSRTGRRPATPSISTICWNSTPPTLLSSAPACRRFAACLRSGNFLSRCSKRDWATSRWNRCASKCWVR